MADRLGEILKKTLSSIESGKEEIFLIAESTRSEIQRLTQELGQLRVDIVQTIKDVDQHQKLERRLRQKLMEVSRDYKKHTEQEMMETYSQATEAQMKLQLLQAKEVQQRSRRDEIERALRQMQATIERAENLMSKVSVAINLLQGSIADIYHGRGTDQRQETGLRVIKAQEDERRRVAREMHDGPAQTLANIVLRLEIAEKLLDLDPSRVKGELKDLKNLVRSNLQDIRRIIFDLRPMALDDLGVIPALKKYLDNFQETYHIQCELRVEGRERRLLPIMEVALFRLIQEGMTNVAKHSASDRVKVCVEFQDEWTSASVQDFGKGFEVDKILEDATEHFGLVGMRERVEMFNGHFTVQSSQGKGTTVEFSIPFVQEEGTAG
ncbi:sensor histidine kinase [Paradesulfitobacterium ferrireducens]|uniref:sensor histidine kinase n=1 Tax=Paradesulfitobacterium ferrireducens TaxID=2816476 RepID=UPI001A8EB026|nr:histidine kinase [Paradesulfitobacterium ferrireducens]